MMSRIDPLSERTLDFCPICEWKGETAPMDEEISEKVSDWVCASILDCTMASRLRLMTERGRVLGARCHGDIVPKM
jgi:hypothetical protein